MKNPKYIYTFKTDIIKFIIISACSVIVYFSWDWLITTQLYYWFNSIYNNFTASIIVSISDIYNLNIIYNDSDFSLIAGNKTLGIQLPYNSYHLFFIAGLYLFLIPAKRHQKMLMQKLLSNIKNHQNFFKKIFIMDCLFWEQKNMNQDV